MVLSAGSFLKKRPGEVVVVSSANVELIKTIPNKKIARFLADIAWAKKALTNMQGLCLWDSDAKHFFSFA